MNSEIAFAVHAEDVAGGAHHLLLDFVLQLGEGLAFKGSIVVSFFQIAACGDDPVPFAKITIGHNLFAEELIPQNGISPGVDDVEYLTWLRF